MRQCRHRWQPQADAVGYIWTVCVDCALERHEEPQPGWYEVADTYERVHAAWERRAEPWQKVMFTARVGLNIYESCDSIESFEACLAQAVADLEDEARGKWRAVGE